MGKSGTGKNLESSFFFFFVCIDSYIYVLGHEYFCTIQFNSAKSFFSQKMKEYLKA